MSPVPLQPSPFRLSLSEIIILEPDKYELAHEIMPPRQLELHQWEAYLSSLASLGFLQWLGECKLFDPSTLTADLIQIGLEGDSRISIIQLGPLKVALFAVEQILDGVITLPQSAILRCPAHFYCIAEVAEEHQEITLKGVLKHDNLMRYFQRYRQFSASSFPVPLSIFDLEPNHFIFYFLYLDPSAMPPSSQGNIVSDPRHLPSSSDRQDASSAPLSKLSQWLQGNLTEEWRSMKDLIHQAKQVEASLRKNDLAVTRAKIINLGTPSEERAFILLINVSLSQEKLTVIVQLHPSSWQDYLPYNLQLKLLSKNGSLLQEVRASSQDNFIQLRGFRGEVGKRFKIASSLGDVTFLEEFEL